MDDTPIIYNNALQRNIRRNGTGAVPYKSIGEETYLRKYAIFLVLFMIAFIWGCTHPNKKIALPVEDTKAVVNTPVAAKEQDKPKETPVQPQKTAETAVPQKAQTQPQPVKAAAASSNYSVKVDISEQRVYVYKENELVKKMICSTGIEKPETMTPRGQYIINKNGDKRGEWFYSKEFKQGAKYWVGFIGGEFLFHSVPMDINKKIIESEAEKLGSPASHGCVRMSVDDAKWFYTTIPKGTSLLIQD